jgi:DNA-binding transcriptional ArsR family regulator
MTTHETPAIQDELLIEDIDTMRQLANPFRLRLLHAFRQPQSVRDVADSMGLPVTRLYYHVKILEDAGAIIIVETRKKGPQLEKIYRIAAHGIRPGPSILQGGVDPVAFAEVAASLVLDSARAELITSLANHAAKGFDPTTINGALGRTLVRLPRERAVEIIDELQAYTVTLKDEDSDPTDALYGFTYSFFPLDPAVDEPPIQPAQAKEESL